MLKSLTYSVTFPSTGRTLTQAVHFKDGFGAIVGPNESGKSFIIEMIRFCWFGTRALRGKTDDYRKLQASLSFVVRDVEYVVERTIGNAKISRGGVELAVGIRPVNDKVVQILGFGLSVFDVACSANQGDLEALGTMQPTERKRMVDSVIGLGVIEDMAKSAGEEANSLRRRAEDLQITAVEPQAPTIPEGYQPTATLRDELTSLTALKTEFDQLNGWLSHIKTEPVEPQCVVAWTAQELSVLLGQQRELHANRMALLKAVEAIPVQDQGVDLDAIEAQIDAWETYSRQQAFLVMYHPPMYSAGDLKKARKACADWETWQKIQHLAQKREDLISKGEHTCPACDFRFPLAADEISSINEQLEDLPLRKKPTAEPELSLAEIDAQEQINARWGLVEAEWESLRSAIEVEKPALDRFGLQAARAAVQDQGRRAKMLGEIADIEAKLAEQPDYQRLLNTRQAYDLAMDRYLADLTAFNDWQAEARRKRERVETLQRLVEGLPALQVRYEAARSYELQLATYEKALDAYTTTAEHIWALSEQSEDWSRAKTALTTLRTMVKQHLVPSLNKVASHLIKQMTGGQRQTIEVDEEFNVSVDNQALNTLSGSGKAVANLALRIGLGQVLTNNILSVFIGDEIDASMDKDRAENTANTLQTLKQRISQILLVTHKLPDADYYISLGNTHDAEYQ